MLEKIEADLRAGHLKDQGPHRKVREARAAIGQLFQVQNLPDVGDAEIKVMFDKHVPKPNHQKCDQWQTSQIL